MRSPAAALAIALFCASPVACKRSVLASVAGFEGEIESDSSSFVGTSTFHNRMVMKGDRMRLESGGDTTIIDYGAKRKYTLDTRARTYKVFDFGAIPPSSPDAGVPAAPPRTRTGKSDTVAGFRCDEYEMKTPGGGVIVQCVTRDIYSPVALAAGALAGMPPDAGFPLRYVVKSAAGTEMWRLEVTRIDKRSVAESDVSVPPGYTEMK